MFCVSVKLARVLEVVTGRYAPCEGSSMPVLHLLSPYIFGTVRKSRGFFLLRKERIG